VVLLAAAAIFRLRDTSPAPGAGKPPRAPVLADRGRAHVRVARQVPVRLRSRSICLPCCLAGRPRCCRSMPAISCWWTGSRSGANGLGLMRAAPGAGAVLVALLLARKPIASGAGAKMLLAVATMASATIGFGLSPQLPPLARPACGTGRGGHGFRVHPQHAGFSCTRPMSVRGRVSAISALPSRPPTSWARCSPASLPHCLGRLARLCLAAWVRVFVTGAGGRPGSRNSARPKFYRRKTSPEGARDMKAANILATIGNTPHIRLFPPVSRPRGMGEERTR